MPGSGVSASPSPAELTNLLNHACRQAGYPPRARLLRHFSNAVYQLDSAPVVARIGYGPRALGTAALSLDVARWLVDQDFPVAAPAQPPSGDDQPFTAPWRDRDTAITFWQYHHQPADRARPDSAALGRMATRLHRLPAPPMPLPAYEPLDELHALLAIPGISAVLRADHHSWLARRVVELRQAFTRLDSDLGTGLIHADMVTGNLLWNTDPRSREPVLLCDWDCVTIGPREVDLVPIHHEPRFGAGRHVIDAFTYSYGYDLTQYSGFPILLEIRELSTLTALLRLAASNTASAAELRHRIDSIMCGDRMIGWNAQ